MSIDGNKHVFPILRAQGAYFKRERGYYWKAFLIWGGTEVNDFVITQSETLVHNISQNEN